MISSELGGTDLSLLTWTPSSKKESRHGTLVIAVSYIK